MLNWWMTVSMTVFGDVDVFVSISKTIIWHFLSHNLTNQRTDKSGMIENI